MTLKRRNLEIENRDYAYIGIDFDNTVVSDLFPEVGLSLGAEPILKKLIANGHKLILWTVRSGEALDKAVDWFKQNDIELFGINENPEFEGDEQARKIYCDLYIDDRSLGIQYDAFFDAPRNKVMRVVNWDSMREQLKLLNLI